jgi:CBS domain containing-hemolysin-like protein
MGSTVALLLLVVMVVLSAIFSGLETGIYRMSRLRLRLRAEKGRWQYVVLSKIMQDGTGLLLSLLVANNLTNYIATSSANYLFQSMISSQRIAELLATSATAPLLFVLAESVPKNVFLLRADLLTAFFAPLLLGTHRLLTYCGIVPLLRFLSQLAARAMGAPAMSPSAITSAHKHHVRAILRDTHEEGLLSPVQTQIIDRIVNVPYLRLNAPMVPLSEVQSVDVRSNRAVLMNKLTKHPLTRLLVWKETPDNIVGFINIYDVLGTDQPFDSLEPFVKPIHRMDSRTPLIDAIDVMRRQELKIVLVMRAKHAELDKPLGIVTMKDLVEELLGELAEW